MFIITLFKESKQNEQKYENDIPWKEVPSMLTQNDTKDLSNWFNDYMFLRPLAGE